jgi:omega-amidase
MDLQRLALIQLEILDGEPSANLERAADLLRLAPPADLYLLPELWTTGYAHETWERAADESTPDALALLGELARQRHAWIGGSMVTRTPNGGLANRFHLLGPNGLELAAYDKGHLFPAMEEDRFLESGNERVRLCMGGWTAALSVCFDLRFPEMYRLDALAGTDLFLIVSAWPRERAEALQLFARARAAENQAYLALCNRVGAGADGTVFGGGSVVVAPDGTILAESGDAQGVLVATIEREGLDRLREDMPLLAMRRAALDWPACDGAGTRPRSSAVSRAGTGPAGHSAS